MNMLKRIVLTASSLALAITANAGSFDNSANIDWQSRSFAHSPQWAGQSGERFQNTVSAKGEIRWRSDDEKQRVAFVPYARWDQVDSQRSLVDVQEGYWAYQTNDTELLVGVNTVFWGVTESAHLVDIINQTDSVADIDGEQKLGQLMLNAALQEEWGLLNIYILPGFRERTFAGTEGRLRPPVAVDTDNAQYESSSEYKHTDFALRYSHYFGDFDVGLSAFTGTSREPRMVFDAVNGQLIPHYDQITQFGIDAQYTHEAYLWKLESIVRDGYSDIFWAAVGGLEYTQYQLFESNLDLGYVIEYQYDDRSETEPATLADNDIFVALRLTFNDVQDTAILAGIFYDPKTKASIGNIELDRRLGKNYTLSSRIRVFNSTINDPAVYALKSDDYFELTISRYF